jgi:hypothetical protein
MATDLRLTIVTLDVARLFIDRIDEHLIVEVISAESIRFEALFGRQPDQRDRDLGLTRLCDLQRDLLMHRARTAGQVTP